MRPLMPDPATRWGYRLQRIWLTPVLRGLLRFGIPCAVVGVGAYAYMAQPHVRQAMAETAIETRAWIEGRPEFTVRLMAVEGAEPTVAEAIRGVAHLDLPMSSFDLDLNALRERVEALPPVQNATLRVRAGGVLEVSVVERTPALIWRTDDGLKVLDVEGVSLADIASRADHSDLPLVAGPGAERAVPEALQLFQASMPIADRIRGLRRMGERRWDIVLDRGQVIQLPEEAPLQALERVILLDNAQELLARDVTVVDLRNPRRPTLRLADTGLEELREIRGMQVGVDVNE